jgi:hypothetical protein
MARLPAAAVPVSPLRVPIRTIVGRCVCRSQLACAFSDGVRARHGYGAPLRATDLNEGPSRAIHSVLGWRSRCGARGRGATSMRAVCGRTRLLFIALVAVTVIACATDRRHTEGDSPVMSEYAGWRIGITPTFRYTVNRWRARVEVWPPDRDHQKHAGISVRFSEEAWDRRVLLQSATDAARRYIDASRAEHR